MAQKTILLAMAWCVMALSGCIAGDDSGSSTDGTSTSTTGGVGVSGNVTAGNTTAGGNVTATGTYGNSTSNTTTSSPSAPMEAEVSIEGSSFVNDTVTIKSGGTVTWTHNDGSTAHTVTADDDSFDSSPNCSPPLTILGGCMAEGDTFSQTFTTPGDYSYHCKVHGSMTGTVKVVA